MPPVQRTDEQQGRDVAATGAATGAGVAAGAAVSATAPAAGAITTAEVLAGATDAVLDAGKIALLLSALSAFFRRKERGDAQVLTAMLRRQYPEQDDGIIRRAVAAEVERERVFQQRALARVERDLLRAGQITDPTDRVTAIRKIMEREQRYVQARADAMTDRSIAAVERSLLRERSPEGAYWKLSPLVKEHTLDCLYMGGKWWPWEVLDLVHPPMHPGCPCRLIGRQEAIASGLISPDEALPTQDDALRKVKQAMERFKRLQEAATPEEIEVLAEATVSAKAMATFEEILHPRDRVGRWRTKGITKQRAKELNKVAKAIRRNSDDGIIDVGSNVRKAADLLVLGYHVKLDQPRTVSILLEEMRKQVKAARDAGENAPNFDLCKVHVPGTNLFCAESKGIPRLHMPQLKGQPIPGSRAAAKTTDWDEKGRVEITDEFRQHLESIGAGLSYERVPASHLRASQIELDGAKVGRFMRRVERGEWSLTGGDRLFISHDDYIVDGHHRWATQVGLGLGSGEDLMTDVIRVDWGIIDLLDEANRFAAEWGIPQAAVFTPEPELTEAWTEHLHPRGRNGKFTSKPKVRPEIRRDFDMAMNDREPPTPSEQVGSRLAAGQAPVVRGDGGKFIAGAFDHGFTFDVSENIYGEGNTPTGRYYEMSNDRGDSVAIRTSQSPGDTKGSTVRVLSSTWRPVAHPTTPRPALDRVPASAEDVERAVLGRADALAQRLGAPVKLTGLSWDASRYDHAAAYQPGRGVVQAGDGILNSLMHYHLVSETGGRLEYSELRDAYLAVQSLSHEIGHAVNPVARSGYDESWERALEEALTEETSHVLTQQWLAEMGMDDVARWAKDNQLDYAVKGTYQRYRTRLRKLIGEVPDDEREAFLMRLKFEQDQDERLRTLAGLWGGPPEEAAREVRAVLGADVDPDMPDRVEGFRPLVTLDRANDPMRPVDHFAGVFDGFEHGGLRAEVTGRMEWKPAGGEVKFTIRDEQGIEVGFGVYDFQGSTAHINRMYLSESARDRGFASALHGSFFGYLRDNGFRRVKLTAVDVGSYAWAQAGFVWQRDAVAEAKRMWERAQQAARTHEMRDGGVPDEAIEKLHRLIEDGHFKSEAELASWGREWTWQAHGQTWWPGKRVMVGNSWDGYLDL